MRQRTPEIIVATVLALLVAGFVAFGSGGGSEGAAQSAETVSPQRLARVERRVEQLRGLEFERPVRVTVMSPAEVEAYGVREERASESRRARRQGRS